MNTKHNRFNPFHHVPLPIPLEGFELRARDIFRERPLTAHLNRNAGWLQARSRTTEAIELALFPDYDLCGMEPEEVWTRINRALWDAGYTPDDPNKENPVWHWLEDESLHTRKDSRA